MPSLTLASDLAAPAAEVWAHATSMAGIDAELGPWLAVRLVAHRRSVEPVPGGCRLTDVVDLEPRLTPLAPAARRLAGTVFRHRHRRLVARFGALPR